MHAPVALTLNPACRLVLTSTECTLCAATLFVDLRRPNVGITKASISLAALFLLSAVVGIHGEYVWDL